MGLVKLRERNLEQLEEPVNGDHLLWNNGERHLKTSSFAEERNRLIQEAHQNRIDALDNHNQVYQLIDKCEEA